MINNFLATTMPMDKCPECGKEYMRRCRRDEWGYYSRCGNGLILFCSGKCLRAYENRQFLKRVKEVEESKAYKALRMVERDNITSIDAIHAVGLKSEAAITNLKLHRWKELEYLEAHGWTTSSANT